MNAIAWPGAGYAIASAALFGASTPAAKWLLGSGVDPWLLAGLLYAGSGLGLFILSCARSLSGRQSSDAPLRRADLPWLAGAIVLGGAIGPVLLLVGLRNIDASTASLLLNVEGLATLAIAWVLFRENVDRRLLVGAFAILSGAVLLTWNGDGGGLSWGALFIVGACLAWGLDNNLTRKLSGADPVQVAMAKGVVAGLVNLTLALLNGAALPGPGVVSLAALVGFLGYGVSLVLFVLALRHLGTARTGAYFSTAPFLGAALSLILFFEPVTLHLLIAGGLMAIGVYLHLSEVHAHEHLHDAIEHEHLHFHDEHHRHGHQPGEIAGEPHSHLHRHAPLRHKHPHYPDLHHRHAH